jgi:hypothetical protein
MGIGMVDTQTRIKHRQQGRGIARALLEMATLDMEPADVQDGFWRELMNLMPQQPNPVAMTNQEASDFEHTKIEFGKHAGELYLHVPISYLSWIADESIKLRRYMMSARAQRRNEQECG